MWRAASRQAGPSAWVPRASPWTAPATMAWERAPGRRGPGPRARGREPARSAGGASAQRSIPAARFATEFPGHCAHTPRRFLAVEFLGLGGPAHAAVACPKLQPPLRERRLEQRRRATRWWESFAEGLSADEVCQVPLVLADGFEERRVRNPGLRIADRKRLCVGARIVDRGLDADVAVVSATETLHDPRRLAARMAEGVKPRTIVEATRVDDQRVALPRANRVSEPRRLGIDRMLSAVEVNQALRVDPLVENHEQARDR